MFETAELGRTVSKEEFDDAEPELRVRLLRAQEELKGTDFPVLILIGGMVASGKGETVNLLHEWMDPRGLEASAFGEPSEEEGERPEFWRFWRALPPKGRIGIFFGSWYTRPVEDRLYGRASEAELDVDLVRIAEMEQMLADDGALILKFWFHLTSDEQRERLEELESNKATRWRVTKRDWKEHERYDEMKALAAHVVQHTSTGAAPWVVIEGADRRYRSLAVAQHILEQVNKRMAERKAARKALKATKPKRIRRSVYTVLDTLDLTKSLEEEKYEAKLERWQGRIFRLSRKLAERKRSAVLVFEGWDAAGKGGAIRRLTGAMDARQYNVMAVAAPSEEERRFHYLWRFWRRLPRAGHVAIFDRSWYGRVLVERVEGFAAEAEWGRAYAEIVRFEEQLAQGGVILHKFWLHIDKAEQMRRFEERQKEAYKQFKITADDFRNRERWNDYELAANEMLERTDTPHAPWTLVPANDKRYARVEVLKTVAKRLESEL